MSAQKYFLRIKYIDSLIQNGKTGNIIQLSKKLGLSKSATFLILKEMRELGFPIKYNFFKSTYYYTKQGQMVETLFKELKVLTPTELRQIQGGKALIREEYLTAI